MDTQIDNIDTLLNEIDKKYPYSKNSRDYAQELREVPSKTSIHDIIATIVTIISGVSESPYFIDCKDFLYGYMNERILKCYEENESSTIESFCEAYINIREHENAEQIKAEIVRIAENRGLKVEDTKAAMKAALDEFNHNYSKLKSFPYFSNGFNQYLPLAKEGAAKLLDYKFEACGLSYAAIHSSGNFFKEVAEERRKEREEKIAKEEKEARDSRAKTIAFIIGGLVLLGIVIGFMVDAKETANWLMAIFIILLVVKFYSQFF